MRLGWDQTVTLPSGTEISIEAAVGDIGRACELLTAIRDGDLQDREWSDIEEMLADLPHVAELLRMLATR